MRLGLWFDMRNPPSDRRPWAAHYGRVLERLEQAERLGFGSVWLSEHHLFVDGYLPQPLTFAAAIAARTHTMRLGTAILQAPLRKAIDIAEQAAIVDIVSGGRLELGLGAGYATAEFDAFGVEHTARHRLLRGHAREILRLWEEGIVTPPPVQSPPPLWIGALGPKLAHFAGTLGAGLLSVKPSLIDAYRDGLAAAGREPASARCSGNPQLILADDPERAWHEIAPRLKWIVESYGAVAATVGGGLAERFTTEVNPDELRIRRGVPAKPGIDVVTPDDALKRLRPWVATLPLADLAFCGDFAGVPDELLDRHIELIGSHLVGALTGPDRPPGPPPGASQGE